MRGAQRKRLIKQNLLRGRKGQPGADHKRQDLRPEALHRRVLSDEKESSRKVEGTLGRGLSMKTRFGPRFSPSISLRGPAASTSWSWAGVGSGGRGWRVNIHSVDMVIGERKSFVLCCKKLGKIFTQRYGMERWLLIIAEAWTCRMAPLDETQGGYGGRGPARNPPPSQDATEPMMGTRFALNQDDVRSELKECQS